MLTYAQAIVLGLIQGFTELFPVSSLGHSVILPQLLGWSGVVAAQSAPESYFLAFLVGLHVATALALLAYFRATWVSVGQGVVASIRARRIETPEQHLGWLLIVATIPAGVVGLALEHGLRVVFAKPLAAAAFLLLNGLILIAGEWVRRRSRLAATEDPRQGVAGAEQALGMRNALVIGAAQTAALLPGISRSGVTMVAGLARGLDHEAAARFSFLLATPIILAAGLYKLPDLLGPNGDGVRPQILAGSIAAGLAAYASVRFLTKYFESRTLTPFALYCLVVGLLAVTRFAQA